MSPVNWITYHVTMTILRNAKNCTPHADVASLSTAGLEAPRRSQGHNASSSVGKGSAAVSRRNAVHQLGRASVPAGVGSGAGTERAANPWPHGVRAYHTHEQRSNTARKCEAIREGGTTKLTRARANRPAGAELPYTTARRGAIPDLRRRWVCSMRGDARTRGRRVRTR